MIICATGRMTVRLRTTDETWGWFACGLNWRKSANEPQTTVICRQRATYSDLTLLTPHDRSPGISPWPLETFWFAAIINWIVYLPKMSLSMAATIESVRNHAASSTVWVWISSLLIGTGVYHHSDNIPMSHGPIPSINTIEDMESINWPRQQQSTSAARQQ